MGNKGTMEEYNSAVAMFRNLEWLHGLLFRESKKGHSAICTAK
jgi:hypothetical protein